MERWRSYDSIADVYDRLVVPYAFAQPAKDLVIALRPPAEGILLDVGTGTGVCAAIARQCIAPAGTVIGVDRSLGMLRVAKQKGLAVAGLVPGLPFRDGIFDAELASFVLSHFRSYQIALLDMVRILKPGGKLGVTTWCLNKTNCRQLWQETAESFVGKEELARASREALRLLKRVLFSVDPGEPGTFALVILVLVFVALLACYIPARRAAKVHPMVALRYE